MNKETLHLNHPAEFGFYSEVNKDGEHLNLNVAGEVVTELEFLLTSFLCKNFGSDDGEWPRGKFGVESLLSLSDEKKRHFEKLVSEIVGHSACFDYFAENE